MTLQKSLSDFLDSTGDEIITQLKTTEGLSDCFQRLIAAVYEDEGFAEERQILHKQTQGREGQDQQLTVEKLKIILQVRKAIMEALRRASNKVLNAPRVTGGKEEYEELKDLIIAIKDGDLAYTTYHWVGTHGAFPVILEDQRSRYRDFLNDLRFSPELQLEIARSNEYQSIPLDLASNHHLTSAAQVSLLNHEHTNVRSFLVGNPQANSPEMMKAVFALEGEKGDIIRMRLVFTDREFPPEILDLIQEDPKLALIHSAKTDSVAEMEMIETAAKTNDEVWMNYVVNQTRLLSEEAVRKLYGLRGEDLGYNRRLSKYPELAKELGLELSKEE
jgi:hypothetical protein